MYFSGGYCIFIAAFDGYRRHENLVSHLLCHPLGKVALCGSKPEVFGWGVAATPPL
jgi:hypothetical protein